MSQARPMAEVVSAYDQWARTYETVENATRDLAATVLRQYPLHLHDRDILEIGCGTGFNTTYLAQQSRSVLAVDGSAGMLAQARSKVAVPHVRLVRCDLQHAWPLADASVDLVICMLVLEHIPDVPAIFHEASRVLRPGGECFVCELHPFRQLQGHQARFTEAGSGKVVLIPAYLHDVSEYVNASGQHGFELVRMRSSYKGPRPGPIRRGSRGRELRVWQEKALELLCHVYSFYGNFTRLLRCLYDSVQHPWYPRSLSERLLQGQCLPTGYPCDITEELDGYRVVLQHTVWTK